MTDILDLSGLNVTLPSGAQILRDVDLRIGRGKVVGLVGESGSGKSTLALALLGLLPAELQITASRTVFDGQGLSDPARLAKRRGADVAMVFQDPMTALSPVFTIGAQLVDAQRRRFPKATQAKLLVRAEAMLTRLGVPDAAARLKLYPHQFSGGMRQRVLIAMALLAEPKLLIADEPTTALDATIELQIVELLRDLRQELDGSILIVSHSLGLIAELCDEVVVLYAGEVVEHGPTAEVLERPRHPYTRALIACEIDPLQGFDPDAPLATIPGSVPDPASAPSGCRFSPRCPLVDAACATPPPRQMAGQSHHFACWRKLEAVA